MKKPLPNSAVVSSSALISLPGIFGSTGKNRFLMTGVIRANTVKSYHSIALPAIAATMALLFVVCIRACLFDVVRELSGGLLRRGVGIAPFVAFELGRRKGLEVLEMNSGII